MPINDLLKNPNCFIIKLKHGGHCDFFSKVAGEKKYKRVSTAAINLCSGTLRSP
jgi:hypothetical protein